MGGREAANQPLVSNKAAVLGGDTHIFFGVFKNHYNPKENFRSSR
jgi:hypothetical protein